jgi:DNA polymerase III alpha subunit
VEALAMGRRFAEIYGDRLYMSLVFHGSPTDKVVNRGLLAIAQRLELDVVAINAVRFAAPEEGPRGPTSAPSESCRRTSSVFVRACGERHR